MGQKKNQVTVLFIPDDTGRTVSIHVHRSIIQALIVFVVLIVSGMTALLYVAGDIAVRLQQVYSLKKENQRLSDENTRLMKITARLESVQRMHEYLVRLADMATENSGVRGLPGSLDASLFEDTVVRTESLNAAGDASELQNKSTSQEQFEGLPYLRPVEGWVTRGFVSADNADANNDHGGVDFAVAEGTPIRATAPGIVIKAGTEEYFGKIVTLEHQFGFVTRYGHCLQLLVSPGDHVTRGQTIALAGNTGRSSAPHLHYEVIKDNRNVDPFRYILTRQ